MKKTLFTLAMFGTISCQTEIPDHQTEMNSLQLDSLQLLEMISIREKSMIEKDIATAMSQFSPDATWINSQGYFFEGKSNVLKFHNMLAGNDSLDYYYEAGVPRVRVIDNHNALVYYSWKMFWYKRSYPSGTTNKELGLMTLTAQKRKGNWYWVAITNQHTPWFYKEIAPVTIE